MFQLTKSTAAKATERTRERKAKVRMRRFGVYAVTGDNGHTYTVSCTIQSGQKIVSCTCQAGQRDRVCYHSGAALALHTYLARQRQRNVIPFRRAA